MGLYKVTYRMQYSKKIGTSCAKNGDHACVRGPDGPKNCCSMACVDADIPGLFNGVNNSYSITVHVGACNLDCGFCWAYPLRVDKNNRIRTPKEVYDDIKCKFGCIVESGQNKNSQPPSALIYSGLEPLLYSREIYETLDLVSKDEELKKLKVLFRTNGTQASKSEISENLRKIHELGLDAKFQVSLKGVNPTQFEWLTRKPKEGFKDQLDGYDELVRIFGKENVNLTLGIYHFESGIRIGSEHFKGFPLILVDETGNKIDFTAYDLTVLKPEHLAQLNDASLHKQNFEIFQTTDGKYGKHHLERSKIIRILCPNGQKFGDLKQIFECGACENPECRRLQDKLNSWF